MAASTHEARQINDDDVFHAGNLEQTLQELQGIVKEHEDALNKVSAVYLLGLYSLDADWNIVTCCSYGPRGPKSPCNGII